ncbi:VOC family protein [Neptuniibacter halophilus]|uniref:VOC family protein n=1 Tax=Neptuniibacter halophilus TaxID=651666 RepID=UPI0025746CB2|nr:VOC family protein [Neptuniibacter halophilus]
MTQHHKIDYVELPAADLSATKRFYSSVFGWKFTEYGEGYSAFSSAGLLGGFYQSEQTSSSEQGAALVVIYSDDLATTQAQIEAAGGRICRPLFEFPGGRRFHFKDPCGNELAVWSDQ